MSSKVLGPCLWSLVLSLGPGLGGEVSGRLIIHRFGGESLDPPPEVQASGAVAFVQQDWSNVDAARRGEATLVDMHGGAIGAVARDPQANISPVTDGAFRPDITGMLYDGDEATFWSATPYSCLEIQRRLWSDAVSASPMPALCARDFSRCSVPVVM